MDKIDAVAELSKLLGISEDERLGLELVVSSPEAYLKKFSERLSSRNVSTVTENLSVIAFADALEACDLNVMREPDWESPPALEWPTIDYSQFDKDHVAYDWIEVLASILPDTGFVLGIVGFDGEPCELFTVREADAEIVFKCCDQYLHVPGECCLLVGQMGLLS